MNELPDRDIGPLTILFGEENGKYPHGNSLLVRGQDRSVIIDPCLGVVARKNRLPDVDWVMLSHVHEDHVAGTHLFPDSPCYAHELDAPGMESFQGMLDIYGFEGELKTNFEKLLLDKFFYESRDRVYRFVDGDQFDLGGVTIEIVHTPGHTRGHCCFEIRWDGCDEGFVYLGDIELTGFGPYYGDAWSDLEDFEASLERLKHLDAKWWLTFHHKGLLESRDQFLEMLEAFRSMIDVREANLLDYLTEPRSMDEIVAHRFVFRPGSEGLMVEQVERRSMAMHLVRLEKAGRVVQHNHTFVGV